MWIAYLSYFALGEGVLVYSGTGSIGYYLTPDKQVIRVGGRGNLIDDGGSGLLGGPRGLEDRPAHRGGEPRRRLDVPLGLTLARGSRRDRLEPRPGVRVRRRPRQDRHPRARRGRSGRDRRPGIPRHSSRQAGRELARLATSLIKRVGQRPVALVGGGSRLHPVVFESFRAELPAATEVVTNDVDAALTAARLATTIG